MKNRKGLWGLAALLVVLDQVTKVLAVKYLKPVGSVSFLPGFMNLTFVENRGAAFGILQGQRWVFLVFTLAVTAGIAVVWKKLGPEPVNEKIRACLAVLLAGAWGNAIDRLCRGYVVDFFHTAFMDFPVFNLADICVVLSVVALMVLILFFVKEDKPS